MNFLFKNSKAGLTVALLVSFALTATQPASATICYTSGKVYMQQKVYDKAATGTSSSRYGNRPLTWNILSRMAKPSRVAPVLLPSSA